MKKVENTTTLYHRIIGLNWSGTENWYRKPMRDSNFVPIRSDPMLTFLKARDVSPSGMVISMRSYGVFHPASRNELLLLLLLLNIFKHGNLSQK